MLAKRVISGIVGLGLFYFIINWGSLPFFILTCLLVFLALTEYCNLVEDNFHLKRKLQVVLALISMVYFYLGKFSPGFFGPLLLFLIIVFFLFHINKYSYKTMVSSLAVNLLGIIYIVGGFQFLIHLRDLTSLSVGGITLLWLVLLGTWAVDTGAYFSGLFWGQKQMSPQISPNKTVAGALGGIVLSLLVVMVYSSLKGFFTPYLIIYALILAPVAIIGDLFASAIKRDMKVKDTGSIIPGHGGILDRFDSLLFTLPYSYFFFLYLL